MKTIAIIFAVLLAACAQPSYDGPAWGDPCAPNTDPNVLVICHHGDWFTESHPKGGYCEPLPEDATEGACRPWCKPDKTCEAGTTPATDPIWGYCYCTEAS